MERVTVQDIEAVGPWIQGLRFPNDYLTSGWTDKEMRPLFAGIDLAGKSYLDVGANAGRDLLRAERAGAAKVVGYDVEDKFRRQFEVVKRAFGLTKAEYHLKSIYDVGVADRADVVMCSGVYYHCEKFMLALQNAWDATGEVLLLAGQVIDGEESIVHFYPHGEYQGDHSTFWVPTRRCLLDIISTWNEVREVRDMTPPGVANWAALQVWREGVAS